MSAFCTDSSGQSTLLLIDSSVNNDLSRCCWSSSVSCYDVISN